MSKLSDQIRQEYREAVASAIEGKDDIEAWGKVYQSLAQSIFSAWLSSVAKNTEGIEECEVAKLIFAKSDCGAGTEGNAGFQPGNTCAGEGKGVIKGTVKGIDDEYLDSVIKKLSEDKEIDSSEQLPNRYDPYQYLNWLLKTSEPIDFGQDKVDIRDEDKGYVNFRGFESLIRSTNRSLKEAITGTEEVWSISFNPEDSKPAQDPTMTIFGRKGGYEEEIQRATENLLKDRLDFHEQYAGGKYAIAQGNVVDMIIRSKLQSKHKGEGDKGRLAKLLDSRKDLQGHLLKYLESFREMNKLTAKANKDIDDLVNDSGLDDVKRIASINDIEAQYVKDIGVQLANAYVENNEIKSIVLADKLTATTYTNNKTKESVKDNIHINKTNYKYKNMQEFMDKYLVSVKPEDAEFHIVTSENSTADLKHPTAPADAVAFRESLPIARQLLIDKNIPLPKIIDIGFGTQRKGKPSTSLGTHKAFGFASGTASNINVNHKSDLIGERKREVQRYKTERTPDTVDFHSITKKENFDEVDKNNAVVSTVIHEIGHYLHHQNLMKKNAERYLSKYEKYKNLDKNNVEEIISFASEYTMYHSQETVGNYLLPLNRLVENEYLTTNGKDPVRRDISSQVSKYAQKNNREFVAETFSGLVYGMEYSKEVIDRYIELGGVVPENEN